MEPLTLIVSAQSFDNITRGDFNVDFSRDNHNRSHLQALMIHHNLVRANASSNIQFTYRKDDHSASSWPDHVLTLSHNVQDVACLDDVDYNFSDHSTYSFQV